MNKREKRAIRKFIKYINAKRLVHIVDSIAKGLGYTEHEVCQKFDYDIFDYIYACGCIQDNESKYGALYDEMIQEQQRQDRRKESRYAAFTNTPGGDEVNEGFKEHDD